MTSNEEVIEIIKKIIREKVRPVLIFDGGNIEYIDYKDNILTVKLLGHCHGCAMAPATLKNAVLEVIREEVPELEEVVALEYDEEELKENL